MINGPDAAAALTCMVLKNKKKSLAVNPTSEETHRGEHQALQPMSRP